MLSYSSHFLYESIIDDIKNKFSKTAESIRKDFDKKINEIEVKLKKNGINISEIKNRAKRDSKSLKIKNGNISGFKEKINFFINSFQKNNFNDDSDNIVSKITVSLIILAAVYYINILLFNFCLGPLGLSSIVSINIVRLICAPLVEEFAKVISVKQNSDGTYFILFNIFEMVYYFMNTPLAPAEFLISRIPTVLMHGLTTMIHRDAHEKDESGKGFTLSVIIHSIWNAFNMLASK